MDGSAYDGPGDDKHWSARGEFWFKSIDDPKPPRARTRDPLVLTGHGVRLRINHGALEVRGGFTHYPQQREEWTYFRGQPDRPSRIILLDADGAVTLDVLGWLSEQGIPLVQLDWRGRVVTAIGTSTLAADPSLLTRQLTAAQDAKQSMAIATWFVREKLARCYQVLCDLVPPSRVRGTALARLEADIERLSRPWEGSQLALMGVEGKSAQTYFAAWQELAPSWKHTDKRPIPESWRTTGIRHSRLKSYAKGATHPLQAMLNYAYAVLESQIRIEVTRLGLDPTVGYLHAWEPDRPTLVLDLLEPLRPVTDRQVLQFVAGRTFSGADFTIAQDGVCRLHPQLARALVSGSGEIREIRTVLAELLKRLGHVHGRTQFWASTAWHAQRELLQNT